MKKCFFVVFFCFFFILSSGFVYSQGCCSGGSGSPIAGGASQGVLLERQMEVAANFQYYNTNKFKTGELDTAQLFDHFNSQYQYTRIAYGVTKDFTMSIEGGYFFNKTQIGLVDTIDVPMDTIVSSGIGDLILFPRYTVFKRTSDASTSEITLGLGYKIPLGKHNDSTLAFVNPITNQQYLTTCPPLVQPTNGSQDIIFYGFFYKGYPKKNFRMFTNILYIKKGWNSLGQKFGDYKSIGLFAGRTFFDNLGLTLQLKGEIIDTMQTDKNVDMQALYNIDVKSTGSKQITFVPQISFSFKSFTVFGLAEFPLYQYVNGVQSVPQTSVTCGLSYRFFTVKSRIPKAGETVYACSMNCAGGDSNQPGKCRVCGMEMDKKQ